jgi:glycerol uptake facilitator-like aquaporin
MADLRLPATYDYPPPPPAYYPPGPGITTTTTTSLNPSVGVDMSGYPPEAPQGYPLPYPTPSAVPQSIRERSFQELYESAKFSNATIGQIAWRLWTTFAMEFFASLFYYTLILSSTMTGVGFLGITFVDAAAIGGLMSIFARENACHIDPLITLMITACGKLGLPWYYMFAHLLAQPIACAVATLLTWAMTPGFDKDLGLGIEVLAFGYTPVWMVNGRSLSNFYEQTEYPYKHNTLFALALFFGRTAADLGFGRIAGIYYNWYPYFFPAVISGQTDTSNWWIWFVGPLLGAVFTVALYYLLHWSDEMSYPVVIKDEDERKAHQA